MIHQIEKENEIAKTLLHGLKRLDNDLKNKDLEGSIATYLNNTSGCKVEKSGQYHPHFLI